MNPQLYSTQGVMRLLGLKSPQWVRARHDAGDLPCTYLNPDNDRKRRYSTASINALIDLHTVWAHHPVPPAPTGQVDALYTLEAAAQLLDYKSPDILYQLIREGVIEYVDLGASTSRRKWRIRQSTITRLIQERTATALAA